MWNVEEVTLTGRNEVVGELHFGKTHLPCAPETRVAAKPPPLRGLVL